MRAVPSYLVLPRPPELVKAVFLPAAYFAGREAEGATGGVSWVEALVLAAAFELLAYQARYMVNDLRGAAADIAHPAALERMRPDLTDPEARRAAMAVVVVRAAATMAVAIAVGGRGGRGLLVAVGVLAAITALYEVMRDIASGREAGHEELPFNSEVTATTAATWGMWLIVGSGYALRVGFGLWLSGTGAGSTVVGALYAGLLGAMFVAMTWVFEGTSFLTGGGTWMPLAAKKRHVTALTRRALVAAPKEARTAKVLERPSARMQPWDVFAVGATAVGAVLGGRLAGSATTGVVLAMTASGLAAGAMTRLAAPWSEAAGAAGVVGAVAAGELAFAPTPLLAGVPVFAACATYLVFRRVSYDQLLGRPSRAPKTTGQAAP